MKVHSRSLLIGSGSDGQPGPPCLFRFHSVSMLFCVSVSFLLCRPLCLSMSLPVFSVTCSLVFTHMEQAHIHVTRRHRGPDTRPAHTCTQAGCTPGHMRIPPTEPSTGPVHILREGGHETLFSVSAGPGQTRPCLPGTGDWELENLS